MSTLFQDNILKKTDVTEQEKLEWLRLFRTENVGPITFYRLLEYYGSAGEALEALPELAKRGGRKKPFIAPSMEKVDREYEALCKIGGEMIVAAEDAYPKNLKTLDDAPPILSVLGNVALLKRGSIGIVGARNASINGRKFTAKLAQELGAREHIITSGLARGIDTAAHKGSLQTGTIAVVAGGIDVVYPEENQDLYEQIKEQGLIVAESPFGQKPFAQSFPKRNRIVSGLSRAVVVVEANMRSGSLITARLAGEQGREVMAVPGHPMDPRAAGPNHLIREGATLVRGADDILEGLINLSGQGFRESFHVVPEIIAPYDDSVDIPDNAHDLVMENLSFNPLSVDELLRSCHLNIGSLQTVLLDLELAGRIVRLSGNRVSLINE